MNETPTLAVLLRSWRARLQPSDVGLPPPSGARRTAGLRREEVADLALISPDYIKRIEQGRAHPSGPVLRALAEALRLSPAEYELVCRLAGLASDRDGLVPQRIGPSVQRLIDRLGDAPIAVFDAAWTHLDHNDLWPALTGVDWSGRRGRTANIVWMTFIEEVVSVRHPYPDEHKASLVADLRDVAGRYPADRELKEMINELRSRSEEFARLWASGTVGHHKTARKTINHPQVGPIELDCDVLSAHGSDVRIVVFTADPGSEAATKLRLLSTLAGENTPPPAEPEGA
ncbi:helix-turn-helix domain-containing protein [Streptomyces sp. 8L]|uniref:helix-turn-helix domain-containing protein n=1 Tax=Streptomyces sp. 8L TaxID=2877242 RepID=UPI001CD31143|nr:helix-turn-helix domain-containing protein [Streptomyces sp. 8L]MCA1223451.1 helix-turn-helix domain-containing protein [Streptomyces sp. 8L]